MSTWHDIIDFGSNQGSQMGVHNAHKIKLPIFSAALLLSHPGNGRQQYLFQFTVKAMFGTAIAYN